KSDLIFDYSSPKNTDGHLFILQDSADSHIGNLNTFTDEIFKSAPYSSKIKKEKGYSAKFSFSKYDIHAINFRRVYFSAYINLNQHQSADFQVVFSVRDIFGNQLDWKSYQVKTDTLNKNRW